MYSIPFQSNWETDFTWLEGGWLYLHVGPNLHAPAKENNQETKTKTKMPGNRKLTFVGYNTGY